MTVPATQTSVPTLTPIEPRSSGAWSSQWVGITRVHMSDWWLSASIDALRQSQMLGVDWDGYGSGPIEADVVETAIGLINQLADAADWMPLPKITPVSGGGVQIDVAGGQREAEIEILPDRSVEIVLSADGQDHEAQGLASQLDVASLISWLLEEPA